MSGEPAASPPEAPREGRLRQAVARARVLASADRLFGLLEQAAGAGSSGDPLVRLPPILRGWRGALRNGDAAGAQAWEDRAAAALEECEAAIGARDRAIPAYRIRWACEHAPLAPLRLPRLARFYRLQPYTPATQSKYEYVLTRLLAGPLGPRRALLAAPERLVERVRALEAVWGGDPVAVDETELQQIQERLKAFAGEAGQHAELAALTESGLIQRAGAFKAGLGERLYAPAVIVAIVECNVALGNALCELLAESPAQDEARAVEVERDEPQAAAGAGERPAEAGAGEGRAEDPPPQAPPAETGSAPELPAAEAAAPPTAEPTPEPAAGSPPAEAAAPPEEEPPPEPSPRAAELGELPENAAVIAAYLRPPRSHEVYRLDLDMFLGPVAALADGDAGAERRKALELILEADDAIWARNEQRGPASDELRARGKGIVREMTMLGVALRGPLAKAQQAGPEAVKPLMYVSDHLLWERLRLESSLGRAAKRPKISLASTGAVAVPAAPAARQRRRAPLLLGLTAAVVLAAGLASTLVAPMPVDAEVVVLDRARLPGAEHVRDARRRRSILYVTVQPSWHQLSPEAKRGHVRELARFGAGLGARRVSLTDASGQPLASFADGEVFLVAAPPSDEELARR